MRRLTFGFRVGIQDCGCGHLFYSVVFFVQLIQRGQKRIRCRQLCWYPRFRRGPDQCCDGCHGTISGFQTICGSGSVIGNAFRSRTEANLFHPRNAPLADAIEAPDRINFIAEEFDTDGVGFVGRENIQNVAAYRALTFALHHGNALVTVLHKPIHKPGGGNGLTFV